jgi:hypothetical protein
MTVSMVAKVDTNTMIAKMDSTLFDLRHAPELGETIEKTASILLQSVGEVSRKGGGIGPNTSGGVTKRRCSVTDYHTLIAQAVGSLDRNASKARRALYERARATQVMQLRAIRPPVSESAIAKERLALESAIRKVETDAARKSEAKSSEPPAPPQPDAARADSERRQKHTKDGPVAFAESEASHPASPLFGRLPRWLAGKRATSFGDVVNEADRLGTTAKGTRDGSGSSGELTPRQTCPPADGEMSPSPSGVKSGDDEASQSASRELSCDLDEGQEALHSGRQQPQAMGDGYLQPSPPRPNRKLLAPVVTLLIFAGIAAAISWQWPRFNELYRDVAQIGEKQQPSQRAPQTASQPKFLGRVPQQQDTAPAPATPMRDNQPSLAVPQRVVLYEEDSSDTQGKRYDGLVRWRTETVSPGQRPASELAVRADVEIPERRTTMTWFLRRNIDHTLAASHTVEIVFNLPANFAGGGIASVPGIMMKQSEEVPGTPLAKLGVKATNGVFTIELSASDANEQRNVQLLKDSEWFDIPIVYVNGTRAILAIEKGPAGDLAFIEALAAWEKK